MIISYNWLKDYLNVSLEVNKMSEVLTDIGLEVGGLETVQSIKGGLEGIVVGEVLTCESHPDADRLSKTTVNVGGEEPLPIVCGAPNVAAGQKVLVATVGAVLYDGDDSFKIKKSKIRGEKSMGMICAEDELGLGKGHDGIMVLDASAVAGTPAKEQFDIQDDYAIEVDLTPNRIDGASHVGVARDLAAFLQQEDKTAKYMMPDVSAFKADNNDYAVEVVVEDAELAPRYCGVTLSGVEVKDSPEWLQNRLKAIGQKPINNIVDATNYVLHELGQPLHAFDGAAIKGDKVVVKTMADKTKFVTLDDQERELSDKDLMICNAEEGMCIAGVFGGAMSGVTEKTTKIFLESAYFNPVSVRKTAKRHTLSTDASFRFERGVDPNSTLYALKRAALLIKELAGGTISSEIVDLYPEVVKPYDVTVSYKNITRLIGKELGEERIKTILAGLEIEIASEKEGVLELKVPTYRVDVLREADIIEDILRIYGYNNIEPGASVKSTITHSVRPDDHKLKNLVAGQLIGAGFNEIMCNSLTKASYYEKLEDYPSAMSVNILNPLSIDLNVMRQTILFGGLESIAYNRNRKQTDLSLFEYGNCYYFDKEDKEEGESNYSQYSQSQHLGLWRVGKMNAAAWNASEQNVSFYELKASVENVLAQSGVNMGSLICGELDSDLFDYGLVYLTKDGQVVVQMGAVSSAILKAQDIDTEVFFADMNWDVVLEAIKKHKVAFAEISKFPEVKRDLSLLISNDVDFAQLEEAAFQTERKFLNSVSIFDVYKGKNLPEGKKSYALSFILQDETKTLKDKQIDRMMNNLIKVYKEEFGAEIR
jgi:phenylalanyl-tRNA synthetase beta chain